MFRFTAFLPVILIAAGTIVKLAVHTENIITKIIIAASDPVIAMTIVDNPFITLIAHFWMPLPDRSTNITHQSIHHHGRLLLTSVAPYGPGYESIIFKQGFKIDLQTEFVSIEIDKEYKNPLYNIEYIETNTPHVVFYPKELSVTFCICEPLRIVLPPAGKETVTVKFGLKFAPLT